MGRSDLQERVSRVTSDEKYLLLAFAHADQKFAGSRDWTAEKFLRILEQGDLFEFFRGPRTDHMHLTALGKDVWEAVTKHRRAPLDLEAAPPDTLPDTR